MRDVIGSRAGFDRIRETMRGAKGMSFKDVIDLSVNQTLSRTTLTSGLTLLSILSLYFAQRFRTSRAGASFRVEARSPSRP